jgi:hypothetical protein
MQNQLTISSIKRLVAIMVAGGMSQEKAINEIAYGYHLKPIAIKAALQYKPEKSQEK